MFINQILSFLPPTLIMWHSTVSLSHWLEFFLSRSVCLLPLWLLSSLPTKPLCNNPLTDTTHWDIFPPTHSSLYKARLGLQALFLDSWTLKLGLISCSTTLVRNYNYSLLNKQKSEVFNYFVAANWNNTISDVVRNTDLKAAFRKWKSWQLH